MNVYAKLKQTHKHTRETSGFQREQGSGHG